MARRSRIAATLTIVGVAALLAAAAAAAALTLPSTTTPTTTIPTVTVPTITTPTVSTPKITTPSASTPKISTPRVTTPTVSTPKVTTPKTTTPQITAPKATTPTSSAPSTTSVGSTVQRAGQALTGSGSVSGGITGAGGSSPSTRGVPAAIVGTGGNGGSSTQTAGGVGQGLSTGSNGAIAPPYGDGPGTGGPGAFGGPGGPGAGALGGLGSRTSMLLLGGADVLQLRAALAPLLGCFYAISPFQQELLVMGAGLDGRAPISLARLASAFGVTSREVARTEHMALRQMRVAALDDGCMVAATASGTLALASAFIDGPFGPPGFVSPVTGPVARPAAVVLAAVGVPSSAVERRSITDQLASLGNSGEPGPIWMILLITVVLCLSFGALLWEARRSV